MMTEPDPAPSPGGRRRPDDLHHLVCHCQLHARQRLALCGDDVSGLVGTPTPDPRPDDVLACCAVCYDLARTVLIARRCERCPS